MKTLEIILAIVTLVGAITLIAVGIRGCKAGLDELNSLDQDMKNAIGDTIILQQDTLIIIDYSLFNENFTLSNGKEVSSEFVTKQIAK